MYDDEKVTFVKYLCGCSYVITYYSDMMWYQLW